MTRSYIKSRRAEAEAETRQRIIEAAVDLHQEIGLDAPFAEIAARAGVGKVTVYRHFPTLNELAPQCSAHYFARHPLPDPDLWREIRDPSAMLCKALEATYSYHKATALMMRQVIRGGFWDHPIMAAYHAHWAHAVEVLADGLETSALCAGQIRAALSLALSYQTWENMSARQGLDEKAAVALILRLIFGPTEGTRPD